jgi:hypothetical protein
MVEQADLALGKYQISGTDAVGTPFVRGPSDEEAKAVEDFLATWGPRSLGHIAVLSGHGEGVLLGMLDDSEQFGIDEVIEALVMHDEVYTAADEAPPDLPEGSRVEQEDRTLVFEVDPATHKWVQAPTVYRTSTNNQLT